MTLLDEADRWIRLFIAIWVLMVSVSIWMCATLRQILGELKRRGKEEL